MLYDKRWDSKKNAKKDDAEVFSLHGLIAWLETKNPDHSYNWEDCDGGCLIGLYYAARGIRDGIYHEVFKSHESYHAVCAAWPWTFGAALSRARKIAESA